MFKDAIYKASVTSQLQNVPSVKRRRKRQPIASSQIFAIKNITWLRSHLVRKALTAVTVKTETNKQTNKQTKSVSPILQPVVARVSKFIDIAGCRDDAVMRALATHQCCLDSIPRLGVVCGLSLLVFHSAPRAFLQVLRFPLSSKPTFDSLCVNYTVSPVTAPALKRLDT